MSIKRKLLLEGFDEHGDPMKEEIEVVIYNRRERFVRWLRRIAPRIFWSGRRFKVVTAISFDATEQDGNS